MVTIRVFFIFDGLIHLTMHQKILLLSLISILLIGYGCSGNASKKSNGPNPDSTITNNQDTIQSSYDSSWVDQIQFGYSNEEGNMIIVDSVIAPLEPNSLIYTLDSTGSKTGLTYKSYQPKGKNDTGRQIY